MWRLSCRRLAAPQSLELVNKKLFVAWLFGLFLTPTLYNNLQHSIEQASPGTCYTMIRLTTCLACLLEKQKDPS